MIALGSEMTNVAINASFTRGGVVGGVEMFVTSLLRALLSLGGDETYTVIVTEDCQDEWSRVIGSSDVKFALYPRKKSIGLVAKLTRMLSRAVAKDDLSTLRYPWQQVEISNGFFEKLPCDVIHFPSQKFVICAKPSIYNPHDLQHLHYPEYFDPFDVARRELLYRTGCAFARKIVTASDWVKKDIVRNYGVTEDKINVIPWAPPTAQYELADDEFLRSVKAEYQLPDEFAFYPAVTWPHKNHLALLSVLTELKREGLKIRFVFSGGHTKYSQQIQEVVKENELSEEVRFLGYVTPEELRALYRLSKFVFVPTLFEAASGPVFEAWQEDAAVACSDVTSLPQQVGNAGLLFDPASPESIKRALIAMDTDKQLREMLRKNGRQRLRDFDWTKTAKAYRAIYRSAANKRLSEEEKVLLKENWMNSDGQEYRV